MSSKQDYSINLNEGTISFWIRAGKFKWNNNQKTTLFEMSGKEGKLLIIKDAKNILKAFYHLKSEGKKEVSTIVENLSIKKDHQITFTWSQKENKIILYLDGEKVDENKIK